MGINDTSLGLLEYVFQTTPPKSVLELGAQRFYQPYPGVPYEGYASTYYQRKGVTSYRCIDLNGENGALQLDLSQPQTIPPADLVTDFGTSEHVAAFTVDQEHAANDHLNDTWKHQDGHLAGMEAFYNCWTTKYRASSHLIASCNPAAGHWPKHGHFYYTEPFYTALCSLTGMQPIVLTTRAALGNAVSGKEVCSLLDVRGSHWISLTEFKTAFEYISPV